MTHCRSEDVAWRLRCITGRATLTAVASMDAIPEPSTVVARTQVPVRDPTPVSQGVLRITHSSAARGTTADTPVTLLSYPTGPKEAANMPRSTSASLLL